MNLKSKVKTIPYRPKKAEGIDIDKGTTQVGLKMLEVYFNTLYMGKTGVRVMRSPTGGFHVYCHEGYTQEEARILGDCKGRQDYWEAQNYTFTFGRKMTWRNVTIGVEEEVNPLSLPFFIVREVFKEMRRSVK